MGAQRCDYLGFNIKLVFDCIGIENLDKFEKMKERLLNAGVSFEDIERIAKDG